MKSITQLHGVTPEDFKKELLDEIRREFQNFRNDYVKQVKSPPILLTRKETAKLLRISLPCLHDWINKGILVPYRPGNRVLFRLEDIERMLESTNYQKPNIR